MQALRPGDTVRIKSGPLASDIGEVEEINQARALVKVRIVKPLVISGLSFGKIRKVVVVRFADVEKV